MMGDAELWELADDIGKNGLEDDIVLHEGLILDGRNRWVACQRAGVEPRTVVWQSNGASPTAYAISKNLHRRHLEPGQRAAIAAEALPMYEAEARQRQGSRTDLPEIFPEGDSGEAREKAAEQFDVNPRYVQDAKRFKERSPEVFERVKSGEWSIPQARTAERVKDADPDLFQKIATGEMTVPKAAEFLFTDPPRETDEERAYYTLSRFRLWTKLDPTAVALACTEPALAAASFQDLSDWIGRVAAALRTNTQQPLRAVK
jgi:hypothetical protein